MQNEFVKICFHLDSAEWHGYETESLWANPIGGSASADIFELQNSPFYFRGVSYLDVVRATNKEGLYEFSEVVAHSGHSTYRLIVDHPTSDFEHWWRKLQAIGCSYESGDFHGKKLFSVDVPELTDINAVYDILEQAERSKVWIFEEAHVGHKLDSD